MNKTPPSKPKLYSFDDHPEHRAQLGPWAQRWIDNALSTKPMDEHDRAAMHTAMAGLYSAANLQPPTRGVFCPGPISGAIAASVAAGVWWLRDHPDKHHALFGRAVSETEIIASAMSACEQAVNAATRAVNGLPPAAPSRPTTSGPTTWAATWAATSAATDAATDAATWAATREATSAATWEATSAATDAATSAATSAATWEATDAATWEATWAATREATDAATWATSPVVRFLLGCCQHWWRMCDGGNMWSAWPAYLSFFQHVAGLELPDYDKFKHYEAAATHAGYRFMHPRFWIACDRPTVVGRDEQSRAHCDTGPQLAWRDGFAVYYVHGVRVPRQVVEAPETLTWQQVRDEPNAEVRRIMLSRYGEARYLDQSGAQLVHEDDFGRLYRAEIPDDEPLVMVRVLNSTPEPDGTTKVYTLRVDPAVTTAREAVASTWRWPDGSRVFPRPEDYAPAIET